MDNCFTLLGARQHCVAKICNASQTANAHKLQNDPFTISNSVPWTPCAPKHALPHHVFRGAMKQSVKIGVTLRWQHLSYTVPCSFCFSFVKLKPEENYHVPPVIKKWQHRSQGLSSSRPEPLLSRSRRARLRVVGFCSWNPPRAELS